MKKTFYHDGQKCPHFKKLHKIVAVLIIFMFVGTSFVLSATEFQQRTVTGTVTDATSGESLPGVSIVLKGTSVGTSTNIDGKYSLSVPGPDAILVFSFVGYNTEETTVQNRTEVNVALIPSLEMLEELIVVGYGTQRRVDLTGSVTRVTMDDKATSPTLNVAQALSGVAAGVSVQKRGRAGGEPNIEIRGRTSLSGSRTPLFVVDGIIYNGSIGNININDVESIDILKDASAAAVYGSRSANGVVIITTKKGKTDKPVISFNGYQGVQDMTNNPMRVMNGQEYATRLTDYYYQQTLYNWYRTNPTSSAGKPASPDYSNREALAARLRTGEERDNFLAGNETDWVKESLQLGRLANYSLSVAGTSNNTNYYLSGGYTSEQGIMKNDTWDRFTLHSNLENNVTDWLTVGLITSYSHQDNSGVSAELHNARRVSPWATNATGADRAMFLTNEVYMPHPLNGLLINHMDKRDNLFMVGSTKVTIPWVEGLSYEFNYSNTFYNRHINQFQPITTPGGVNNRGHAQKTPEQRREWILNNIVTYRRSFGDHQVNSTLLYSRENRQNQWSRLTAQGFDNDVLGFNRMQLGTIVNVESSAWEENSISYMARAHYSYLNRYMITGTIRQDGFSGFGPEQKFATFPSVSVGWVVSDEAFMGGLDGLYLKLRTSYGANGNQGIGRYSSFSTMASNAYVFGPQTSISVWPNALGNASLGWEKTTSFNIGADYGILNQRISGSIDVYQAETTDVLVRRALPRTSGYENVWANLGAIENRGIEMDLRTVNFEGDFRWESSFIFSLNRDKITKLYGDENDRDVGNSWFVGESITAIYDYEMAGGVWTEEDLYSGNILAGWYPGQFRYVDQDGDGLITGEDRAIIGNRAPSYRFSINNNFSYKNFTLSVFVNSVQGGKNGYMENNADVLNVLFRSDDVLRVNASAVRPYWTPENGVTNATGVYNTPRVSSGIWQSRSFVRLQDVQLSYTFGPGLLGRLNLQGSQFYIASQNLYTWTNWSGWDPETFRTDNNFERNSPLMRNVTAGFRFSL
jgi:TonB-dependent starch-binding outer membrane protein SusC